MKKKTLITLFILITVKLIAKEQIGTCNKNVFNVGFIQNNIPVCFYFEEEQGLISKIIKNYIKIGDKIFGPYDSIESWLFTSDSIIYTAKQNEHYGLFINGENVNFYNSISNFFLSNDKETLTYAYETDSGTYIKSGEEEFGPFDTIKYFLVFDDKLLSYVVNEKSNFYIYTEDTKFGPFDDVSDLIYQGNSFTYKVTINKNQYIYNKNGCFAGPFDTLYFNCFSNDGTLLAYVTAKENSASKSIPGITSTLWVNNKMIEEAWLISDVYFTNEDELIYSYSNYEEKYGSFIKFGNKKFGPFIQIRDLALSNNNTQIAFAYSNDYAPNSKYYVSVGNEEAGPYEDIYHITFSHNDNSLAYVIKEKNNYFLIYNQKKYGPYKSIFNITFSENNESLAYTTDEDYKNYVLHIDNFHTKKYDYLMNIYFQNNIIHYTAEKDGIYYNKIILNNKEIVGNYLNEHLIYIQDGIINLE